MGETLVIGQAAAAAGATKKGLCTGNNGNFHLAALWLSPSSSARLRQQILMLGCIT